MLNQPLGDMFYYGKSYGFHIFKNVTMFWWVLWEEKSGFPQSHNNYDFYRL